MCLLYGCNQTPTNVCRGSFQKYFIIAIWCCVKVTRVHWTCRCLMPKKIVLREQHLVLGWQQEAAFESVGWFFRFILSSIFQMVFVGLIFASITNLAEAQKQWQQTGGGRSMPAGRRILSVRTPPTSPPTMIPLACPSTRWGLTARGTFNDVS